MLCLPAMHGHPTRRRVSSLAGASSWTIGHRRRPVNLVNLQCSALLGETLFHSKIRISDCLYTLRLSILGLNMLPLLGIH